MEEKYPKIAPIDYLSERFKMSIHPAANGWQFKRKYTLPILCPTQAELIREIEKTISEFNQAMKAAKP